MRFESYDCSCGCPVVAALERIGATSIQCPDSSRPARQEEEKGLSSVGLFFDLEASYGPLLARAVIRRLTMTARGMHRIFFSNPEHRTTNR
jgi:hypothetical protein